MMSFFPRQFCAPAAETSFVPLFRLLEDFDNYSREAQHAPAAQAAPASHAAPACRRQRIRQPRPHVATFNPRFDVRETENTYELHGELPGLERENVNIEFTEPQTIVIRGRVERSYGPEANKTSNETSSETPAESTPAQATEPTETEKRRNSHQATVEDDPEDENTPASSRAASPWTEVAKPATQEVAKPASEEAQDQSRYWRWERWSASSPRTFSFPARVDHDGVTASLNNGILSVTVPKAKNIAPRRIEIRF
ncbi:hypothetical protein NEMBOFW57_001193 [Staphylotrichum longicolle]|uniref:SHSP domain-containing protein n=1 Tax=Staphylotrichum longicolle TaxID=669026 RepID=A0AAD4I1I0_9PEZI|nr:hypothetical protein NEMBOFW57_001193 [Staphylotrichum longicolle]